MWTHTSETRSIANNNHVFLPRDERYACNTADNGVENPTVSAVSHLGITAQNKSPTDADLLHTTAENGDEHEDSQIRAACADLKRWCFLFPRAWEPGRWLWGVYVCVLFLFPL